MAEPEPSLPAATLMAETAMKTSAQQNGFPETMSRSIRRPLSQPAPPKHTWQRRRHKNRLR
jgi:hypothetical protein